MEKQSFYLVYTLIELDGSVSDCHTLFGSLEKAALAMQDEIKEAREKFSIGKTTQDFERFYEFRTEDGYGFSVGIEEFIL